MRYRTLPRSGIRVSVIGFGASPLGNEFGSIDPAEGGRAVHRALEQGINFFDVSPYYGRGLAEERLGAALEGKRAQIVLATKCGRYDTKYFDFSAARIRASVDESLKRLRTDYLDILHAHDIEFADREQIVNETLPAMRKLKEQGKVRLVGITGYPLKLLADVAVRGGADVVMSYCRYNLLVRDLDAYLTPVLRNNGIGLLNASPLHMGILSERGAPSWHPAPESVRDAGRQIVDLGKSRGIDASVTALRFCLDHPYITSTFIGTSKPEEVDANVKALDSRNDPEFLADVERVAGGVLNTKWPSGCPENED